MEAVEWIWDKAALAGPFAAVVMAAVAFYSERLRRSTIKTIYERHSRELDKRDEKYTALMDDQRALLARITDAALDKEGKK